MTKVFHEINKDLKNYLHTLFKTVFVIYVSYFSSSSIICENACIFLLMIKQDIQRVINRGR